MPLLLPEPHHINNKDSLPSEPSISSVLPHEARDLEDEDGNTWTAWSELGDGYSIYTIFGFGPTTIDRTVGHGEASTTDTSRSTLHTTMTAFMLPFRQGPVQEIDSSTTDMADHITATSTVTWTDFATLTFIDGSADLKHTLTLDESSDTSTLSNNMASSNTDLSLFSTITIMPPAETWSTLYTASQSLPDTPTATVTVSSSAQVSLSTVEWIGVTIGIISIFAAVSAVLLIFVLRRRRELRPAESQNNINIRLDNIPAAPPVSRWSRNTSSRSNLPRSNYTDSRELKTTFVPRRLGVVGPPPTYEGDQKYHTGEYQEQDIGIQERTVEASGPVNEAYSSAVYNDPKWKGKQREEF
ncbi:hypothetical protein FGRMN_6385 [Fusarium graminum]|nr:hypothetical protein FGRMN_6385 [Fusarium graminum]